MSLQQSLQSLGLKDKEISIYLALAKNGSMTPARISAITKINRATVYHIAKALQSKGLITEDSTHKTSVFMPLPPRHLMELIRRPRHELNEKERLIKETITELDTLSAQREYPVPRMQFVPEQDIENFLYNNTIKWQESILSADGVWWGFNDRQASTQYENWIKWVWTTPQSKHKKFVLRVISNVSETEKKLAQHIHPRKRTVHFWDDIEFASGMWIAGDYVIILANKQHPHYLFEICDKALAQNLRGLFAKLWEQKNRCM